MKLYLQRHGQSPSIAAAGVVSDEERPLSDQGRKDVLQMARSLSEKGGNPILILSSPLLRARQTAAVVAQILKPPRGVQCYEPLSNRIDGTELFKRLSKDNRGLMEIMIVGHQPQLGEMIAALTGKTLNIQPGGLVILETGEDDHAKLLWSQNP